MNHLSCLALLALVAAAPTRALADELDLDGDGRAELFLGTTPPDLASPYAHGALYEAGAPLFGPSPAQEFVQPRGLGTANHGIRPGCNLGDLTGDGRSEIVLSRSFDNDGVHVFHGGPTGLIAPAEQSLYSPLGRLQTGPGSGFGTGVDAGDVDGDGIMDLVVGAVENVYLFRGVGGGRFETTPTSARTSVLSQGYAEVGDINGDGFSDAVTGAPGHAGFSGRLDVFFGSSSGLATTAVSLVGPAGSFYGHAFVVDDWNQDGFADVAVSAPRSNRVYVHLGSAAGVGPLSSAIVFASGVDQRELGTFIGGVGDWNGDGYPDFAASFVSGANTIPSVKLFAGSPTGASEVAVLTGPAMSQDMIVPVGCGDLDGDGKAEVAVALRTNTTTVPTQIRIYRGGALGLVPAADQTLSGTTPDGNTISANIMGHNAGLITLNEAPVADAGADQAIVVGQRVFLQGTGTDDNTAPERLDYAWSFVSRPAGSSAVLDGADTRTPSFVADVIGGYDVELVVTDEGGLSSPADALLVSSGNVRPDASAGPDRSTVVGQAVTLDGSASSDANGHALTFAWTLVSRPAGSAATISGPTATSPTLVPDVAGSYTAQLVVNDGHASSTPDEVVVTAISGAVHAQRRIGDALNTLAGLPTSAFRAPGHRQALSNFLAQALAALQAGDVAEARAKLESAVTRVDGVALRGAIDGNGPGMDWVVDGAAQLSIYTALTDALGSL